jgi:hypothetical protein
MQVQEGFVIASVGGHNGGNVFIANRALGSGQVLRPLRCGVSIQRQEDIGQ